MKRFLLSISQTFIFLVFCSSSAFSDDTVLDSNCIIECAYSSKSDCETNACLWDAAKLPACTRNSRKIKCGENSEGSLACQLKGCIFIPSITDETWCYYPGNNINAADKQAIESKQILANSKAKESCKTGCNAFSESECKALGCKWSDNSALQPRCYTESFVPRCGHAYETQDSCKARGCVWTVNKTGFEAQCKYPKSPQFLIDCHPDTTPNSNVQEQCIKRGCLWYEHTVDPKAPKCVFGNDVGYKVSEVVFESNTDFLGQIERKPSPQIFGKDVQKVDLSVAGSDSGLIAIIALAKQFPSDFAANSLFSMPTSVLNSKQKAAAVDAVVQVQHAPFGLKIVRKSTNFTIFDSVDIPGLTISDGYIQYSTKLSTKYIYGFGELTHSQLKQKMEWRNFGIWNHDTPPDPANKEDQNLYGFHPFYIGVEPDGKAHGILFGDPAAVNFAFQPDPDVLTVRSLGFGVNMIVVVGDSPGDVIEKYVGNPFASIKPVLPPLWGLGYQLSRYGYKDTADVMTVYNRNKALGIPFDVQTIDIDYMDEYRCFTVNSKFSGFNREGDAISTIRTDNRKLVLIIDPGISINGDKYRTVTEGIESDIFIKNGKGENLKGVVWPGRVYFPDFTHPNITNFWTKQLGRLHELAEFDGIWYDMNEPSNFVDGSMEGCMTNRLNTPPYNPLKYDSEPFYHKTICNDARTAVGNFSLFHSVYGFNEVKVGYESALRLNGSTRPYILTRSTAPGSGHYAAHWSGDISSSFASLRYSIINMMEFGMFGIPWVGSDICGFMGNADEELCIRWHQVGVFYPFARNHNGLGNKNQDPAAWSSFGQKTMRDFIKFRYSLLPFLYTEMAKAHRTGRPAVRPLFLEYPTDPNALEISDQFLWGSHMMIAPIVRRGALSRTVYFPQGMWYDSFTKAVVEVSGGRLGVVVPMNLSQTGAYVKGGIVVPFQDPAHTTHEVSRSPLTLWVALDEQGSARGELYVDDQEHPDPYDPAAGGNFEHFEFISSVQCPTASSAMQHVDGYLLVKRNHRSTEKDLFVPSIKTITISGLESPHFLLQSVGVNGEYADAVWQKGTGASISIVNLDINIASGNHTVITFSSRALP